jgi:Spy/CpxP family protein refolding chaperone
MNSLFGKSYGAGVLALAVSALLLCAAGVEVRAQPGGESPPPSQEGAAPPAGPRDVVALLRRLNLTPEQVGQLRAIRQQHQLEARPLLRRLNQARRALDEAIYADGLNEELIRERSREVAEAQAAVLRLNTLVEVRVRRILTAEQLQRFRDLRREAQALQRLRRRRERTGQPPPQGDAFNDNRPNRRAAPPADNTNAPRPALDRPRRRRNSLGRP